ncbi:MFS transporter [Parafrankia sp. FMc6]|uniref:MFS transporter n=1 Tax=Parafrankia soli TaxID=2599596 RepID=UPI0034D403B9
MFRSLSVRNFRLFASGQLVSLIGTWMGMTTLDWLVLALGGGGTELGITLALQYGPMLLFGLYAGVVADRFPKLRLLLITQSSAAVLSVAACALIASGALRMPMLFVLSGLLGVVTSFDAPIRQAFIVEMVGAPLLPNAVALNSMIFNAGRIAGPAAAGGLIGIAGTMPGAAWVFGLNALSFAAVLTGLARIRTGDLLPARPVQRARGQLRAGLSYAVRHREIATPILLVGIVGALGLNFPVTVALMASEQFGGTAATYGLLTAMLAVGSIAGAAVSARRLDVPRHTTLIVATAAFGVSETLFGLMPNLWLFALLAIPTGACVLLVSTMANALVQLSTDDAMRGRVMGVFLLVFIGTTPIGAPIVGAVCEAFGPRAGLALGGVSSLLAAAIVALFDLRRPPAAARAAGRGPAGPRLAVGGLKARPSHPACETLRPPPAGASR